MKYFKLKEISEIKNGEQCNYSDKGIIPVYGSNGIIGYTDDLNAPENSIIIGRVGANAGSVFYSLKKHWVSDNAISVVPNVNKVNPFYLYYALFNLDLNRLVEGSAQPLINQSILNSFEISVPSLSVQTSVIEKIRVFDEKIAINNQINDNLVFQKCLFIKMFFKLFILLFICLKIKLEKSIFNTFQGFVLFPKLYYKFVKQNIFFYIIFKEFICSNIWKFYIQYIFIIKIFYSSCSIFIIEK